MKGRYQLNTEDECEEGFDHPFNEAEQFTLHPHNIQLEPQAFQSLQPSVLKKTKHKAVEKHILSKTSPKTELDALQKTNFQQLRSLVRHSKVSSLIEARTNDDQTPILDVSQSKSLIMKKKQKGLRRQRSLQGFKEELQVVLFKSKRQIGEDLALKTHHSVLEDQIKQMLKKSQTVTVAFKQKDMHSTHSYFRQITKHEENTFINHRFNASLKQRLEKAKPNLDHSDSKGTSDIQFKSDFECGNMELALKIAQNQYNIYLRMDTNSNGHQCWFYFQMINHEDTGRRVKINLCKLKKKMRMISKGQKIFVKRDQAWVQLGEELQLIKQDQKVYKLSFSISLKPKQSLFISLIPPYTYSQLLANLKQYEQSPHVKVEILTYSIASLAIPILTITKDAKRQVKAQKILKKKLYLISGRIHPSQTCSSYIIDGLIRSLLSGNRETQAFLCTSIIKIIPMLNPDGVVFGNFRTSYLGDDLNRSFNQSDEAIYPQVTALKELAKLCKSEFGDNFQAFIDMHGHSSRPNAFVYGPDCSNGDQGIEWRTFPKIFDKLSKYFSYELSSFKLEQYKVNTARGHFIKKYKIPSFTVETSYALFKEKQAQGNFRPMGIRQWGQLGIELADALLVFTQYVLFAKRRIATQMAFKKRLREKDEAASKHSKLGISFFDLYSEIKQELCQNINKQDAVDESSQSSDGDAIEEDLPVNEKELLTKKVREVFQASYLLPRSMKPSMILPAIVPSIVVITNKQKRNLNMMMAPKLSSKIRSKKFARPLNCNNEFNEHLLRNVNGLDSLRPEVINFSTLVAKRLKEEAENHHKVM